MDPVNIENRKTKIVVDNGMTDVANATNVDSSRKVSNVVSKSKSWGNRLKASRPTVVAIDIED